MFFTKGKSNKVQDVKSNKKKDDKLNVKWNGYDNLFNNWVDKKDIA